jgi:hypothetical protein
MCMGSGPIEPHFLDSALAGGEWLAPRPCRFNAGERAPGTNWIRGLVDPRASSYRSKFNNISW